ncbi:precorrin-3B methylase [Natronospira proteinivora]|uniref:Precorrin-3B methylase n=1 Tax=Natronospira proteinivora TaxID=1807133 RepID=A0ABT1G947_9GAMM|nr:SAM-dependent methyltransferase [Natronospira proteinivora]MCP1727844.1 precorrin-3B methylase [Natronospira proteinivora]
MKAGELVVVGSGIQLGRDLSERTLSEIEAADVVFCLTDAYMLDWLCQHRPDTRPLNDYYGENKDRRDTYREMQAAIMAPVYQGYRVCAVFYGHPGVFADAPHRAIREARAAGHRARMLPGISAEACLYADLGLDPGNHGVQSLEATHFLVYEHVINPAALLILWQVALAGDLDCRRFHADPRGLSLLIEKLERWYPPDTPVLLYEAAQLPLEACRAERMTLAALPQARYQEYTTLVIPPIHAPAKDPAVRRALAGEEDRQSLKCEAGTARVS